MSRELHDTLIQDFTGTSLSLQRAFNKVESAPADAKAILGNVLSSTDLALDRARRRILEARGMPTNTVCTALERVVARHQDQTKARIVLKCEPGDTPLPAPLRSEIAALAEELLRNAIKHAGATRIEIAYSRTASGMTLCVQDDGCGFDPDGVGPDRFGLVGARERAASLDLVLSIESAPGRGTTVTASA